MTSPSVRPERPGFFVAAILFHVVEGFTTVVLGTFGVLGLALTATIVAVSADPHDAGIAVLVLCGVMALVAFLVALGLFTLFLAYKAWGMERFWVLALIVFSVLSLTVEPCGILVTVVTLIGGLQALEAVDREKRATGSAAP